MVEVNTGQDCPQCSSRCITQSSDGKISVGRLPFFRCIYPSLADIYADQSVSDVIESISVKATECSEQMYGKKPTVSALGNCRGDWNELLFHDSALNVLEREEFDDYDIVKMPSSTAGRHFYDMLVASEKNKVKSLNLNFSNPDFIILKLSESTRSIKFIPGSSRIEALLNKHSDTSYFGKVRLADIVCFISLKTSTRPDRRYQPLHEANSLKAIGEKMGVPLRYVSVSTNGSPRDLDISGSSSIVSVIKQTDPTSELSKAIDDDWTFEKYADVEGFIQRIMAGESIPNGSVRQSTL